MMIKTMKDNDEEEGCICGITYIYLKSVMLGIFISFFFLRTTTMILLLYALIGYNDNIN